LTCGVGFPKLGVIRITNEGEERRGMATEKSILWASPKKNNKEEEISVQPV